MKSSKKAIYYTRKGTTRKGTTRKGTYTRKGTRQKKTYIKKKRSGGLGKSREEPFYTPVEELYPAEGDDCLNCNGYNESSADDFESPDISLLTEYSFGTYEAMIEGIKRIIDFDSKENVDNHPYYKSVLHEIIKNIETKKKGKEDELPKIILLLMHLTISPSNVIYYISYICKIPVKDIIDTIEEALELLEISSAEILQFIHTPRPIKTTDNKTGWMLSSLLIILLFEVIFPILYNDVIKPINNSNVITFGLLDSYFNKRRYESLQDYYYHDSNKIPIDTEAIETNLANIKNIGDFFNPAKNSSGILPPIILFLLSSRINPLMNANAHVISNFNPAPESKKFMENFRDEMINLINGNQMLKTMKLTCNKSCGKEKSKKTFLFKNPFKTKTLKKSTHNIEPLQNDSDLIANTTCQYNKQSSVIIKLIAFYLKYFAGKKEDFKLVQTQTCADLCREIKWTTFDPFFNIFTNIDVKGEKEYMLMLNIIYTIIPYSVFLPLNLNSYFKEVTFKNAPIYYDKMVEFYEKKLLCYYCSENTDEIIKDPLCVSNVLMARIDSEWKESIV